MVYFIVGKESFQIKNRLKKVIKEFFKDDEEQNIVKIDLNEDSIGTFYDEINQMFLAFSKKMVILEHLTLADLEVPKSKGKGKSKKVEKPKIDINELIDSLKLLDETIAVTITTNDEFDSNHPLYISASENGAIFNLREVKKNDWPQFVNEYFGKKGIRIEPDANEELIARCQYDLNTFSNEATKLTLYKKEIITLKDIQDLVAPSLDEDLFKILNSLMVGDKKTALRVYRDLRLKNTEPVSLISTMGSNLLYMLNVKSLLEQGKNADDIATITGSSSGRVYMTSKSLRRVSLDFLEEKISQLYSLDSKIKHNEIDRFIAFELFLANF